MPDGPTLSWIAAAVGLGDGEVQFFDSGFVDTVPVVFPDIEVTISVNGETFLDTVIDLRAVPFTIAN